ncbi:uncharacterized protein LOC128205353 [Mya arenaria]|uniref:uncharacterized protein LOC128205353 n=1 Tax=Mya arenaria TaxID=6604 RepID=UPI0022E4A26B|nr:uncharacterized protein LOC128205353 [Mya arenaria]
MVQRCAWGTCNADERYPDRLNGGRFIRFPTPKSDFEKCKRWIKACGRPHEQLNVKRINKHKAVCSKHFHGGNGPSKEYPDPLSADGSRTTPARKLPTKRSLEKENFDSIHTQNAKLKRMHLQDITCLQNQEKLVKDNAVTVPGVETQTECP